MTAFTAGASASDRPANRKVKQVLKREYTINDTETDKRNQDDDINKTK